MKMQEIYVKASTDFFPLDVFMLQKYYRINATEEWNKYYLD